MCWGTLVYAALCLMLCLAAPAPFAAAATYFVAPNGNNSQEGTEKQPWKTPQHASDSVKPGDTVLIDAGLYSPAKGTWNVTCAGTAEAPITFKTRGDGEVRISASSLLPADGWKHFKGAIYQTEIRTPTTCVFQNGLPLVGPGKNQPVPSVDEMYPNSFFLAEKGTTLYVWLADGSDPGKSEMRTAPMHVIQMIGCNYTIFDGLTVEFGFNGFKEQKDSHHVTIRNCVIRSLRSQGIQPVPYNCVIEGNLFQRIGASRYEHAMYGSRPGIIVRNNVFEEIGGAAVHQYTQGEVKADSGWEISGNVFRKPRKYTTEKGGRYYTDLILWACDGNKVFNNSFYGEGKRSGISIHSSNNRIYDNKFIQCPTPVSSSKGTGNEIRDNAIQ